MKAFLPLVFLLGMAGHAASREVPLPAWSERLSPVAFEELPSAGASSGEAGIPPEGTSEESGDLLSDFANDPPMEPELEPNGEAAGVNEPEAVILSERSLEAFFSAAAEDRMVDPQGLLEADQAARIGAVLENHASDSRIGLQVWLLRQGQDFPADVRLEELHERRPAEQGPTVVVIAVLGRPEATRWFPSWDLGGGVTAAELRRMLQAAVPFAMRESDPAAQIAELLHHLSLRLYWVESRLASDAPRGNMHGENQDGAEQTGVANAPAGMPAWLAWLFEGPLAGVSRKDLSFLVLAFLTCIAGCAFLTVRARRREWLFPEIEVETRLAGPHAAGVGAVISYASPNLPPALQRESLPDYLSRA